MSDWFFIWLMLIPSISVFLTTFTVLVFLQDENVRQFFLDRREQKLRHVERRLLHVERMARIAEGLFDYTEEG